MGNLGSEPYRALNTTLSSMDLNYYTMRNLSKSLEEYNVRIEGKISSVLGFWMAGLYRRLGTTKRVPLRPEDCRPEVRG